MSRPEGNTLQIAVFFHKLNSDQLPFKPGKTEATCGTELCYYYGCLFIIVVTVVTPLTVGRRYHGDVAGCRTFTDLNKMGGLNIHVTCIYIYILVGGLEHLLFFHILRIIIPTD